MHHSNQTKNLISSAILLGTAFIGIDVAKASNKNCIDLLNKTPIALQSQQILSRTEYINSIFTGSQLYSIVFKSDQPQAHDPIPGIYVRSQQNWKLMIPGDVMVDHHGAAITQLSIGRVDDKNYFLSLVNGHLYLTSSYSDLQNQNSYVTFGTTQTPLLEVGSLQKRYLSRIESFENISIYQDPNFSSKGSQLVLVSIKFKHKESVGEAITFGFELAPNKQNNHIQFSTHPTVIDYDFHDTKKLAELYITTVSNKKVLYSKILIDRVQNADLRNFGSHIQLLKEKITNYANNIASSLKPGFNVSSGNVQDHLLSFNITDNLVSKDIHFSQVVLKSTGLQITQSYTPLLGKSELIINTESQKDLRLPGHIDLLDANPEHFALWTSTDQRAAIFSVDGTFYAVSERKYSIAKNSAMIVKLGGINEIFNYQGIPSDMPKKLSFYFHHSPIEGGTSKLVYVLSAEMKNGRGFTAAYRYKIYDDEFAKQEASFKLLDYYLDEENIGVRVKLQSTEHLLFDAQTPQSNLNTYQVTYDASKPHIHLFDSIHGTPVVRFLKPKNIVSILPQLHYAFFSGKTHLTDPTGLYANLAANDVTGNETDRIYGELIKNPLFTGMIAENDQTNAYKPFIFAKDEIVLTENQNEDQDKKRLVYQILLLAVDIHKSNGTKGFQFILVISDPNKNIHMSAVDMPRNWNQNILSFQEASLIRSRQNLKHLNYLIVSLKEPETQREATLSIAIDLKQKSFKSMQAHTIDSQIIPRKSFEERIGYDDEGSPIVITTPNMSRESHQFTIYDLRNHNREFPNQHYGIGGRKYTFGDWKQGTETLDSYIRLQDSWRIFPENIRKKYPDLGRSRELSQFDNFKKLGRKLDEMANTNNPAERLILVVPDKLKDIVWDYVIYKGFTGDRDYAPTGKNTIQSFSNANRELNLNLIQDRNSQDQYLANLDSWVKLKRTQPRDRNFLLARMDEILNNDNGFPRPNRNTNNGFQIGEIVAGESHEIGEVSSKLEKRHPHALYLLAAGHPMTLEEFKQSKDSAQSSMFILATPDEMEKLKKSASMEMDHGLLDRFHIEEIKDPDADSMSLSLRQIFDNPEVKSLGFQFSAKEIRRNVQLSPEENFNLVIDYAISRFSHLIENKNDSRFESFMRFRTAFANSILSDREVRRTRIINKHFIERVLNQVFDIPMNLETLPEDDPLKILSREDALVLMQKHGFLGPFDLKEIVRDTILSQTKPDAGKTIPSSFLLTGKSGTGKTKIVLSLIEMLKLKIYDFNNSNNNQDASAFYLNCGQVLESNGNNRAGSLDVQQAIEHLDNFLASPNGYRGFIFIDDITAAPEAVRAKLLTWMRSLFESQNGLYTAKSGRDIVRRPIRNLNLFLAMNPVDDLEQVNRFAADKNNPTLEETIIASLSTKDFKIDTSFLKRWSRIINRGYVAASARGPELEKFLRKNSSSLLNTNNRISLVDHRLISSLSSIFEKVDIRNFLRSSVSALTNIASDTHSNDPLIMVIPSRYIPQGTGVDSSLSDNDKIEFWAKKNARILAASNSVEGQLAFILVNVNAFRIPIYENFILSLQEDIRFSGSISAQQSLLAPILAALSDHLKERGYIELQDIDLSANHFGFKTSTERESFKKIMEQFIIPGATNMFPQSMLSLSSGETTFEGLLKNHLPKLGSRSRKELLNEVTSNSSLLFKERLTKILRVSDLQYLPQVNQWVQHMPQAYDIQNLSTGLKLSDQLWDYLNRIFKTSDPTPNMSLSVYSAMRLYLLSLDRAIVNLPWVPTSRFLIQAVDLITQDKVLSHKPEVHDFLFTNPEGLIKTTLTDFAEDYIASSKSLKEIPDTTRKNLNESFIKNRELLIGQ